MKSNVFGKKKLVSYIFMALPCYGYSAEIYREKDQDEFTLGDIHVTDKRNKFNGEHLNAGDINRFRGSTNGDVFSGLSGVQVNSVRNEAGAIDVGIRGIQGEGRVPVIIDGSLQSTHTFRGYQGESDRTYIDMDLISNIHIDKGTSISKYTTGAIGGLVQMKTLGVDDIIIPGESFGLLFKGNIYNNNRKPDIPDSEEGQQHYLLANDISPGTFNNGAITAAIAWQNDTLDMVAALSKREVGNYFAGSNGIDRYGDAAVVSAGQEVVNTSYQSDSGIIKLGLNLVDNQRLEFNFRRHVQKAGEVMAAYWHKAPHDTDPSVVYAWYPPEGVDSMPQWSPGSAIVNAWNASYSFQAESTSLVDLNIGMWKTTADFKQHNGITGSGNYGDQYKHSYSDDRQGVNLSNRSILSPLPLTLDYGVVYEEQRMEPRDDMELATSRNGRRTEQSGYLNATLEYPLATVVVGNRIHQANVTDYQAPQQVNYSAKTDWLSQLTLHVSQNIDVYAKASSTYRNPSLFESTQSQQTYNYDPNNPLQPENARSWEIGISSEFDDIFTHGEEIDVKVAYFDNRIKNLISAAQLPNGPNDPWWRYNLSFRNYDSMTLRGVELALSYDNRTFFIDSSAIFYRQPEICSHAEAEKIGGSDCNEIGYAWSMVSARIPPERAFNLTIGTRLFNEDLTLGTRLKYHSGKENPQDWLQGTAARAVVAVPSEKIIDLFALYRVNPKLNLTFNVDNLTDRYAFDPGTVIGMPMPGRTIRAGIDVRF